MLQIKIEKNTFRFEATPVLAELTLRVLIGKINADRPLEDAPTTAVRTAIRTDFAQRLAEALKAEESGCRHRAILIEKLTDSGLDSIAAQLELERGKVETDAELRVRLEAANVVEEQPLHATILASAIAMAHELVGKKEIAAMLDQLSASYGVV